ncbi:hypothetical protein niasHT_012101 [Heterodera trifolii]|uniref:BTB domain-containing protein n=1 Tax=Heterodera trifolii TaxID=157864 RepID=A0ABD2LA66_9BILA
MNDSELLAQIISWNWYNGTQNIRKTFLLKKRGTIGADGEIHLPVSLVIRFLKKRELIENPCPPICSPDDDLTVHIGDGQLIISAHWLMSVSPMIKRMLSVEMKEKHQRAINLDGLGITMEQFSELADAISISSNEHTN